MTTTLPILLITLALGSGPGCGVDYVGLEYSNIPTELRQGGSAYIESSGGRNIGLQLVHCEEYSELWLTRWLTDSAGRGPDQVITALKLPPIASDQRIIFGNSNCRLNKKFDPWVVALVQYDAEARFFSHVYRAWKIDIEKNSFEEIDTEGIDCINEGSGV
ncbi:MAG: hypothetical protein IFK94_15745 [Acidobacteria bacterium]|uniref:Uncharacterized protein n=1 Tax=Candidatus Polarisedimenticola svalbardensis TaxID=2886004 RepID=A0A8J6XXL7_9BACT|nr:hypothetical protein [Candidatus Polarisedimenticola svalbardensis]